MSFRFALNWIILEVTFFPFIQPFSPCESPLALLGQNLTLADYVDLLEMCDKVIEKFSPSYR